MTDVVGANDAGKQMSTGPADGGAGEGAGCPNKPNACPTTFKIDAPCRIINANDGSITLKASDVGEYTGGTFTWSITKGNNIVLSNTIGTQVGVSAKDKKSFSRSRDAEEVTVTRDAPDCPSIKQQILLTVAKVTFSQSSGNNNKYGYDDFDDDGKPGNPDDDHICVETGKSTCVHVKIDGGLTAADFDFVCDDSGICAAGALDSNFDIQLTAANGLQQSHTVLNAKGKCTDAIVFSKIAVHVYKQKVVEVVVARFDYGVTLNNVLVLSNDPKKSTLKITKTTNFAAFTNTANAKLREAVVKYNIHNFQDDNSVTPLAFEAGSGVFTFDYGTNNGADLAAIKKLMTNANTAGKKRVAIFGQISAYYRLKYAIRKGYIGWWQTLKNIFSKTNVITLTFDADNTYFEANKSYDLGIGSSKETIKVLTKNGNTVTCAPTKYDHPVNDRMFFGIGGCSTDPIIIQEGGATELETEWTVIHEVGHAKLDLLDIDDINDVMHFQQRAKDSEGDRRLRFCPRTLHYQDDKKKYPNGENQWEKIPRG